MRVDEFDFDLPEDRIALRPARPRDASRLLVVRPDSRPLLDDCRFTDLPQLLRSGDVVVFNDTRVLPAALEGVREREGQRARVSVTLLKRIDAMRWDGLARPAKRLRQGDRIRFGGEGRLCLLGTLDATVEGRGAGGEVRLRFDFHGSMLDEALEAVGAMPLPPYIASRRPTDDSDAQDYQTIFARQPGAVAAPTAGLHFTERIMKGLEARGVSHCFVTLHVGAGTFQPVRVEDTEDHRMHSEWGSICTQTADMLNAARARGGRIVSAGTTALRLLETAADAGGLIRPFAGETDIFITPGYRFRGVDLLLTNFHLPRSTLFMLVSAFAGLDVMKRAYAHAIDAGYRFYSYGDACLLYPEAA